MKMVGFWSLLVALISLSAGGQTGHRVTNKTELELMELERRWSKADAEGDVAMELGILAPDFYGTDAHAEIKNRQQVLTDLKATKPTGEAEVPDDMKVRLYGGTAVVTGRFTRIKDGKVTLHGRFTDVFVQRNGTWMAVANHYSIADNNPPKR